MNPPDGDRNLLFGLLALQLDLIDQRQFVEACTAWAAHKEEPLASVLCRRGWITAGDRDDIDRVLRRKVDRHGGDVRQSLASVVTGRLGCPADDVEDADFAFYSAVTQLSVDDPGDATPTVDAPPEVRRNFPLVRLHARGGMGRVWVARDTALGREVALKELLPGRAVDPSMRARFLREARITGQLEHPNIVPIYELVSGPEQGRAFYTMRFVRGRRLTDVIRDHHRDRQACQAGALELNELLNAFVAVCNAVAYAHSRHVVHRDLKGQNVVLGDFGEVVVLDWGLAKVVHQPDEIGGPSTVEIDDGDELDLTLPGQRLGTPGYMAPEQAEGRGDTVGPVSDVYGLGAILYEILTGQRPYRDSKIDEALRLAREEGPPPARQACPSVPPALEAVCLKAMARRPEGRYESATELAREVQRWLADEPVAAYRDPALTRLGRWARRHRTAVTGVASLMLTATLAMAIGTVLIGRSYRAEADQRRRSDASYLLAREAVDHLVYGVLNDPLLMETRMDRLLRTSSRTALDFYTKLARSNPDDPDLRYRLGLAYQRLARVTLRQGSATEAIEQSRRALEILVPLASAHPSSDTYQRPLALAYAKLAESFHQEQKVGEAEDTYQRALAIARGVAERTLDPADLLSLADIQSSIGRLRASASDWDGAASAFGEALKTCHRIAGSGPGRSDSVEVRFRTALCRASLGHFARMTGDRGRAARYLWQAKGELDDLVSEAPTPDHLSESALVDQSLGKLLVDSRKRNQARDAFGEARDRWKELAEGYPDTPSYRLGEAAVLLNLGDLDSPVVHPDGTPELARQAYLAALAIWDREASRHRDRPLLDFERARTRYLLGELFLKENQRDQARRYLIEARDIWDRMPPRATGEYDRKFRDKLRGYLAELGETTPEPGPDAKGAPAENRPVP